MIRSAAKNQAYVGVVVDPGDYAGLLDELRGSGGSLSDDTRARLALKAFERTAAYDTAIHAYLAERWGAESERLPARFDASLPRAATLRYGENPHQGAALYGSFLEVAEPLSTSPGSVIMPPANTRMDSLLFSLRSRRISGN